MQIEYALAAVAAGAPSVGIKGMAPIWSILLCNSFILYIAKDGVVLASENKMKSILYEESSVHKIEKIDDHIGMVYSGMGPDFRYEWRK